MCKSTSSVCVCCANAADGLKLEPASFQRKQYSRSTPGAPYNGGEIKLELLYFSGQIPRPVTDLE